MLHMDPVSRACNPGRMKPSLRGIGRLRESLHAEEELGGQFLWHNTLSNLQLTSGWYLDRAIRTGSNWFHDFSNFGLYCTEGTPVSNERQFLSNGHVRKRFSGCTICNVKDKFQGISLEHVALYGTLWCSTSMLSSWKFDCPGLKTRPAFANWEIIIL